MRHIVVGSRKSPLALAQTEQVIADLERICQERGIACTFEVKKMVTKGDQILDVALSKVGGKGLFVKEIEQAMLDGVVHMAVHSMKDMPAQFPEPLMIAAVPQRVDVRDCLISMGNRSLAELPEGAIVGTSSLRRASQLKAYRPDFIIKPVRGNINTRLRKLEDEGMDAIVLAVAGLQRMDWIPRISDYLSPEICIPAVGQGALAVQCRKDDAFMRELLGHYNDIDTDTVVRAERSFLNELNGGCQVPIAAYGVLEGLADGSQMISLVGMVGSPEGETILKDVMTGSTSDPEALGLALAQKLIERGANRILADYRGESLPLS